MEKKDTGMSCSFAEKHWNKVAMLIARGKTGTGTDMHRAGLAWAKKNYK